jgi:bacterioferritin
MSISSAFTISKHFPAPGLGIFGRNMASVGAADLTADERDTGAPVGTPDRVLIQALNDALGDELACVLRYMGHGVVSRRLAMPQEADRFQRYASEESMHARRLTQRIAQLGGEADPVSRSIDWRSTVVLDDATDLPEMIRSSLSAEGESIDIYCRILNLVSGRDLATQKMVEDILIEELQHAEELWTWQPDRGALPKSIVLI